MLGLPLSRPRPPGRGAPAQTTRLTLRSRAPFRARLQTNRLSGVADRRERESFLQDANRSLPRIVWSVSQPRAHVGTGTCTSSNFERLRAPSTWSGVPSTAWSFGLGSTSLALAGRFGTTTASRRRSASSASEMFGLHGSCLRHPIRWSLELIGARLSWRRGAWPLNCAPGSSSFTATSSAERRPGGPPGPSEKQSRPSDALPHRTRAS